MDPEASSIGLTSEDKNFKTENTCVKNTQYTKRKSQFKAPTSQKRRKVEQRKDNSKVDENGALESSIKHPIRRSMRSGNVKTGVENTLSKTNKENEDKGYQQEKDSNANILNIIPEKVFVSLENTFFPDDVCNSSSYKDIVVKDNNLFEENKIFECSEVNEDEKILGDKNSNNDAVVTEQNTTMINNDSQTDIENAQVDYDKPQLESKNLKEEYILQKNKNDEIQNISNQQSEANGNKDSIQKENGRTKKITEKENFAEKNNSELATTAETEHLRILTSTAQNLVINENQENIFSNLRSIKNIKDVNNENGCEKSKDIPINEFSQIDKNLGKLYIDIKEADKIINMLSVSNNIEEISYDLNEIVNHSVSVFENSKQNNIFFNGNMLEKDSSVSENCHSSPGKKNAELKVKSTINMEDQIIRNENAHLSSHIIKDLDVNNIINMDISDSADSIHLNLDETSNFQKSRSVGSDRDIKIAESEINTSLDKNCDLGTKGMKQNLLQNNKESLNTENNRNSDNEFLLDNGMNASEESFKIIGQQSRLENKNKENCNDIITMKTEANMTKKNQEASQKILIIPHMTELQVWKAMAEKSQVNDETSTLFYYSEMHLDTFKKNEGESSSYEDKFKINVDKSTSEEKSTENISKKSIAEQKTLTIPHINAMEVWKALENRSGEKNETYTSFCHPEMHSDTLKINEEEPSSYEDKFKVNVEKLASEEKSTENTSKKKTLTIPHMNAMEIWKAMQNKSDEKDETNIVNYLSNDIQEKTIFCTDEDDGGRTDEHKINTKGYEEHKIIKDETVNAKIDEISEQRNVHDSQNLSNKEYDDQNITQENPNTLMYELNSVKSVNIEQFVINGNKPEMKKDLFGKKDEINIAQEPSHKEADKIYNKNTSLQQSEINNTIEVDKLNNNIEVNTEETDMQHVNKYLDEDITAADYFKSELNSKIDNGVITNESTTDTREIEAANTDIEDNFDFDDDFNLTASQLNMIEDNANQTKESGTTKVNFCQQTESCGSTHFGLDSVTVEVIDQLCYIRESVESIKGLLSTLLKNANLKK